MPDNANVILRIEDLHTHFYTDAGVIRALDGVDFTVERGKVLGIVGESGCGKSVTAQCILNMVPEPWAHRQRQNPLLSSCRRRRSPVRMPLRSPACIHVGAQCAASAATRSP